MHLLPFMRYAASWQPDSARPVAPGGPSRGATPGRAGYSWRAGAGASTAVMRRIEACRRTNLGAGLLAPPYRNGLVKGVTTGPGRVAAG